MAEYRTATVTTVEHRYILSSPTNVVEISKAFASAQTAWKTANPGKDMYDNTFMVRAWDDEIHVYWVEEKR